MSDSTGIAGSVWNFAVPRDPRSTLRCAIVSLSGASTMVTKSYAPSTAYWATTLQPNDSTSAFTADNLSGLAWTVCAPSVVSVVSMMYVGIATPFRGGSPGPADRRWYVAGPIWPRAARRPTRSCCLHLEHALLPPPRPSAPLDMQRSPTQGRASPNDPRAALQGQRRGGSRRARAL